MPSVINTNVASLNAQRNLSVSQASLHMSLQRLSSGLRINSAKDDAAGLAISDRMSSQIRGLNQAARNANDGVSLAQTAEGSMAEVTNNLQRIRELAVQSANSTNSTADRLALDSEVQQRVSEINRVATQTSFNGLKLLDGTFSAQQFQIGANAGETITISTIASVKTSALGLGAGSTTGTAATAALLAGDVTINAFDVGAVGAADAKAMATAINGNASITGSGVTATATNTFAAAFTTVTNSATVQNNGVALASGVVSGGITNGSLTVNGSAITTGGGTTSAKALASAINLAQGTTGVTAAAVATDTSVAASGTALAAFVTTVGGTYDLTVGGVTILSGAAIGTTAANVNTALTAATTNLAAAGITFSGSAANTTLKFMKADGGNVDIVETTNAGSTAGGFYGKTTATTSTNTYSSSVNLTSANGAVITLGGTSPSAAGFTSLTTGAGGKYTLNVAGTTLGFDMASGSYGNKIQATNIVSAVNANATLAGLGITAAIDANSKIAFTRADGGLIALTEDVADSAAVSGNSFSYTGSSANLTTTGAPGFAASDAASVVVTHIGTLTLSSTKDLAVAGTSVAKAGLTAGSFGGANVLTVAGANAMLTSIDVALGLVSSSRSSLGALQNRFESAISNIAATSENLTASRSRILDADFAVETANLTRGQILQQAGTAMLAQANALPNTVLSLLRG